ncbi:MAG: hypothetical protein WD767_08200 [Alphaproteobacteria bacterium]
MDGVTGRLAGFVAETGFEDLPAAIVARVTVRGETHEAFVEAPKGGPGNFMDESEFMDEFNTLCGHYMSKPAMDRFARGLLTLDQANSVASVPGFGQAH